MTRQGRAGHGRKCKVDDQGGREVVRLDIRVRPVSEAPFDRRDEVAADPLGAHGAALEGLVQGHVPTTQTLAAPVEDLREAQLGAANSETDAVATRFSLIELDERGGSGVGRAGNCATNGNETAPPGLPTDGAHP